MPVKKKRDYRTESIQIWEARQKFDQYYKDNTGNSIGEFRGKIFDMLYQKSSLPRKKGKRRRKDGIDVEYTFNPTIKCNNTKKNKNIKNSIGEKETLKPGHCEKGSIKYLLPKGPKTFDIVGVDSFPEGTKFKVPGDSKNKSYTSKGHTLVKQIDKITKVVKNSANKGDKNKKIYGPRYSNDGELYSSKFRKAYKARKGRFKEKKEKDLEFPSDTTSQLLNLVEARWNKYKRKKKLSKKPGKKRKIRKKKKPRPKAHILFHIGFSNTEDMLESEDAGIPSSRRYTLIKNSKDKLVIKHSNVEISESSLEYLHLNSFIKTIKLKIKRKIIDTIMEVKYLKIKLEKEDDDDDDDDDDDTVGEGEKSEYTFILNIHTGDLLNIKNPHKKVFNNLSAFYKSKKADYEITQSTRIDI